MTKTADKHGRPYLKLSEIDNKTVVQVDNGFTCLPSWAKQVVCDEGQGPFIFCKHGKHYLHGQADDGEHCIGIYKV